MNEYSFAERYQDRRKTAIVPMNDKESCDFLYDVDCETKIDMDERFGVLINYNWQCNTIANYAIEAIIKALYVDMKESGAKSAQFNFYNLFYAKVSTKINEKAEKEGNINISFSPGPTAIALISTNETKANEVIEKTTFLEMFKVENPDEDPEIIKAQNERYIAIDRQARYVISNNYGIVISDNNTLMTFGVCYYFFINIFKKLLREISTRPNTNHISVNFNDNIEFHVSKEELSEEDGTGIKFAMRPGVHAKLLIKSDETTEDDEISENVWVSNLIG